MLSRRAPSSVIALGLTALLFFLLVVYGHRNFYRDPGSIFFDPSRALEQKYSAHRTREALAFRSDAYERIHNATENASFEFGKSGDNPLLCGVFVTMGRDTYAGVHPLELAVSSSLAGLVQPERLDLDLRVYFANTDPEEHPHWKSWLLNLVDGWTTARDMVNTTELQKLVELEAKKDFFSKSAFDFASALHYCYNASSAPYIALFEGDILFADSWLSRIKLALQDIVARVKSTNDQWLDVRLFNDEKNVGFASNSLFGNGVPLVIFGISATLLCAFRAIRCLTTKSKETLSNAFIFVICCITVPLFVILFFQAGKSSVLTPAPGVTIQNWGCCSQAIVMPRDRVPELAAELVRKAGTPADMLIKYFALDKGLKRFALNPVQVQHMGFKSLLTPDRSQVRSVWSVAFENLDPQILKKDHNKMLQDLYGSGFL